MAITVTAINDKETKNTQRFQIEQPEDSAPKAEGSIYIPKWALKEIGNSKRIKITIEQA